MSYLSNQIAKIDAYLKKRFEQQEIERRLENQQRVLSLISLGKRYEEYENTPPSVRSIVETTVGFASIAVIVGFAVFVCVERTSF